MKTYVIMREKAGGAMGELYEFWGRECRNMHGIEGWRDSQDDAICYFIPAIAVSQAEALKVDCVIIQDYGTETQDVYKEFAPVPERRPDARQEMIGRQKKAAVDAEKPYKTPTLEDGYQCEICFAKGCGIHSMNLICDDCQNALPLLLKSVGELSDLRELYQEYQDAKEAQETNDWNRKWLNRFMPLIDKLLE